jgi:hypothetical protein
MYLLCILANVCGIHGHYKDVDILGTAFGCGSNPPLITWVDPVFLMYYSSFIEVLDTLSCYEYKEINHIPSKEQKLLLMFTCLYLY